ncbi:hypothetical protein [Fictibacillus fluitans]|uniref:Uncharacterized protein n=1 Tax=Fictibacillus fluitans TaxID=3058422 RepID=A0ABT8HS78_9BACL|nr:hypothetical protein [Fictibacillus sp. NE201]MDN4523340.1 hypothetical protein [Fictibacillus sp. NE201]
MDDITVGLYTIPFIFIQIAVAVFVTYVYLFFTLERGNRKQVFEGYTNGLILWLFVWKLSVIIFYFPLLSKSLLSLLYFSGGEKGFLLGEAMFFAYFIIKTKGVKIDWFHSLLRVWIVGLLAYELAVIVGNDFSLLLLYNSAVLIVFLLWNHVDKSEAATFSSLIKAVLLAAIEVLFSYFTFNQWNTSSSFFVIYGMGLFALFLTERNVRLYQIFK